MEAKSITLITANEAEQRINVILPRIFLTSKQMLPAFKKLGFSCEKLSIPTLTKKYKITLPIGWNYTICKDDDFQYEISIVDEKGRTRGYANTLKEKNITALGLTKRYNFVSRDNEKNGFDFFLADYDGTKVYVAGCFEYENIFLNTIETKRISEELKAKVEQYAENNLPMWKDPTAYWD